MYEITSQPELTAPVLLVGFDGWINAGGAGTATLERLAADAEPFVRFDPDLLFDYQDQRPWHELREGVIERFDWPEVTMRAIDVGGRDLIVLTGTEPSLRWRAFTSSVADLAVEFGVSELISVGGIPWAVPHTRPIPILTTSSDRSRIPDIDDHPEGLIRVPAAISRAVELALSEHGVPAMGFWARVPQYVGVDLHAAALALTVRIERHLGVSFDTTELRSDAEAQRIHLDAIADARPDIAAIVERLETMVDATEPESGEALAAEIERFLANRPDDGGISE